MGIQAPGQRPAAATSAQPGLLKELSNEGKKLVEMMTQVLNDGKGFSPDTWEQLAHQRDCMAPADHAALRAASKEGTRELLNKVVAQDPRPLARQTAQAWLGMLEHGVQLPGFGAEHAAGKPDAKGWGHK